MTGIILTLGSAGLMCAAGLGVTSALQWFHSWEPDLTRKPKRERVEDNPHEDRIDDIRRKARLTR